MYWPGWSRPEQERGEWTWMRRVVWLWICEEETFQPAAGEEERGGERQEIPDPSIHWTFRTAVCRLIHSPRDISLGDAMALSLFCILYCCSVAQSLSLTLVQPHRLQPARLLCSWDSPGENMEWVAISSSRASSQPRDWTHVSCIAGRFFPTEPQGNPSAFCIHPKFLSQEVWPLAYGSLHLNPLNLWVPEKCPFVGLRLCWCRVVKYKYRIEGSCSTGWSLGSVIGDRLIVGASLMVQKEKNLPAMPEIWVRSLDQEYPWRREWQTTTVFLPEEFHGQRSLEGYSSWGRKESNMTEQLTLCW